MLWRALHRTVGAAQQVHEDVAMHGQWINEIRGTLCMVECAPQMYMFCIMTAWGMVEGCVGERRLAEILYRGGDTILEEEHVREKQQMRGLRYRYRYVEPTFGKIIESKRCRGPFKAPTSYLFYEVRMVDNRCSGPSLDNRCAK